jgi:hypothetical protein
MFVDKHLKTARAILREMEEKAAAGEPRATLDAMFDNFSASYAEAPERHRRFLRDEFAATEFWAKGKVWKDGDSYHRRFWEMDRDLRDLRRALVVESLMDGGNDTRDAIVGMDDLIVFARGSSMDYRPVFAEVAAMSSAVDRMGLGSMRALMESRSKA